MQYLLHKQLQGLCTQYSSLGLTRDFYRPIAIYTVYSCLFLNVLLIVCTVYHVLHLLYV